VGEVRKPLQLEFGQRLTPEGYVRGEAIDAGGRLLRRPFGSRISVALKLDRKPDEPLLAGMDVLSFDVREWLKATMRLEARWTASSEFYAQMSDHAGRLTVEAVRASRDAEALEALVRFLRDRGWELQRYIAKTRRGELIGEATNRGRQLALGRVEPRQRGPTLDPTRLPLDALERLIQTHRDLVVVEALRAELRRRLGG
jgi:hypothetical protein